MTESVNAVTGRVFPDAGIFPSVAAASLEYGSAPHEITASGGKALSFFWAKLGRNVAFRKVMHPGFPGASFLRSSLAEMRGQISTTLENAAADEVRK